MIKFYRLNLDYVKYLHQNFDNRVQYYEQGGDAYNKNRPYIGIVLKIGEKNYFAPLEHPRSSHVKIKANDHIIKIDGGKYGLVALNNMIPVPVSQLISLDIKNDPNKNILEKQFIFCDNIKQKILDSAEKVYNSRVNNPNKFLKKVCCDFLKLEEGYDLYIEHEKEISDKVTDTKEKSMVNMENDFELEVD